MAVTFPMTDAEADAIMTECRETNDNSLDWAKCVGNRSGQDWANWDTLGDGYPAASLSADNLKKYWKIVHTSPGLSTDYEDMVGTLLPTESGMPAAPENPQSFLKRMTRDSAEKWSANADDVNTVTDADVTKAATTGTNTDVDLKLQLTWKVNGIFRPLIWRAKPVWGGKQAEARVAEAAAKAEAGKVKAAREAAAAEAAAANARANRNKVWAIVGVGVALLAALFAKFGRGPKAVEATTGTPPTNGGGDTKPSKGKGPKTAAKTGGPSANIGEIKFGNVKIFEGGARSDGVSALAEVLGKNKGKPGYEGVKRQVAKSAESVGIPMSEVEAAASRGRKTPAPKKAKKK